MKIHIRYILLLLCYISLTKTSLSQTDTEFWFVAPEVNDYHSDADDDGSEGQPTYLRITTYDEAATVVISLPADSTFIPDTLPTIPPNTTYSVEYRRGTGANELLDEIENTLELYEENISNKGLHITSSSEVTCYYEIGATNNREILSLKGGNALGTTFYVPFQTHLVNLNTWGNDDFYSPYSAFDVLATEDDTEVKIIPTVDMYISDSLTGSKIIPANTEYSVILNKGQVFSGAPYEAMSDPVHIHDISDNLRLAGTKVWCTDAAKPIAVNTKDDLVWDNAGDVDFIGDQLIPIDHIGYEYAVMKGKRSSAGGGDGDERVYILATQDGTDIYVDDVFETTIDAGEQYTYIITNKTTHFRSDTSTNKPFYVFHVSGNEGQLGGAVIPPISTCTGSTEVAISRSDAAAFHMMVLVWDGDPFDDYTDDFTVEVNGVVKSIIQSSDFDTVQGNSEWKAALIENIPLADIGVDEPTIVSNDKTVFHLGILNGAGDCFFGYFSNFNEMLIGAKVDEDQAGANAKKCLGDPVPLRVEGGLSASWSPHTYLDDPYHETPTAYPLSDITYIATIKGYCNQDTSDKVEIILEPPIEAIFSLDKTQGCSPLEVEFENTSLGAKYHKWDFNNDGTFDQFDTIPDLIFDTYDYNEFSFTHTFENNSDTIVEYQIILAVKTESCTDTIMRTVVVFPEAKPGIQYTDSIGCHPLTSDLSYIDTSLVDSVFYMWQLGDGSSRSDSSFTYAFSNNTTINKTYNVILEAKTKQQCVYYDTLPVTVYPKVDAIYNYDKSSICSPDSIYIANFSNGPNLKYSWDFGDCDTLVTNSKSSFYKTYDTIDVPYSQVNYENYNLQLAIQDTISGCTDTSIQTVTVYPGIIASYLPNTDTSNIAPLTLQLTNNSQTNLDSTYFEWDFGDGTSSNQTSPTHLYTNTNPNGTTYTISMYASTKYNCKDTAQSIDVTVYSPIEAKINIDNTSGCSPIQFSISNSSIGENHRYYWTFGEGSDTTVFNKNTIYHTYTLPFTQDTFEEYTIKLLVTDTISNAISEDSIVVKVFPPVQAAFTGTPNNNQGCQPYYISYANNSSIAAASYKWEFSDGSSSNQPAPIHTFINTSDSVETSYARLIATSIYNCKDTTGYENYSVGPNIDAGMSIDTTAGCSPFEVSIENTSNNVDLFSWDFGDGTTSTSSSSILSKTYNNSSLSTNYDTLKLVVEYAATGCQDSVEQTLIIYPESDVSFNTSIDRGCQPLEVQFNNTSNSVAKYIYWDFGDNNTSNQHSPTHIYANTGTDSVENTVQLIGISEYLCSDTVTSTISVMPYIYANFYVDTANSCSPINFNVFNTTIGGNYYEWYIDGVLDTITTDLNSFSYNFDNQSDTVRNINIKLIAKNTNYGNCTSADSLTVHVYPKIEAIIAVSDSINCNPLTIDFSGIASIGATGSVPYKWNFGEGNNSTSSEPKHTFYNTGLNDSVFTVCLKVTSQYQCTDIAIKNITVHPAIEAHFEADKTSGCPNLDVQFQNTSTQTATDYVWDFNDSSPVSNDENPEYTFVNDDPLNQKTFTVLLTVTDNNHGGCSDIYTKNVVVFPKPTASFTPKDSIGCHPFDVQFFDQSQGTKLIYYWKFDENNASGDTQPLFTFLNTDPDNTKPYNVSLKVVSKENCVAYDSTTISVYPYLKTEFTLDEYAGCTPFTININNNTLGATYYNWNFGDGKTSNEEIPNHEYKVYTKDTLTNYTVNLTAGNSGCVQTYSKDITVYPEIMASFEQGSGCHPFTVNFNNQSRGYNPSYTWDFDDGGTSSVEAPEHTFYNLGTEDLVRHIKLEAVSEHGCTDSFSAYDTIFANPKARFILENSADCSPFTVNITNTSEASIFNWDFGDGTIKSTSSQIVQHEYVNTTEAPIPYNIQLEVINVNGCTDSLTQPINVYPSVEAVIGINEEDTLRCQPAGITLYNNTPVSPATDPLWEFGDGQTSRIDDPKHTFVNETHKNKFYNVKLTVESRYGCKHSDSTRIQIFPNPEANFEISPDTLIFEEPYVSISIENKTKFDEEGIWDYTWNFGDGNGSYSGEITSYDYKSVKASQPGVENDYKYYITLTAKNDICTDTIKKSVVILPHRPIARIFADKTEGCPPLDVRFSSASTDHEEYIKWNFGDGTYSSQEFYIKTYDSTGVYKVNLHAYGFGGEHDTSIYITVHDDPKANFKVVDKVVDIAEDTAMFINLSSPKDDLTYSWDFGDGNTSDMFEPEHIYYTENEEGYDVTLYVETSYGCWDSYTYPNAISAISSCEISFPNAFIPCKDGPCSDSYSINDKTDNTFHPYFQDGVNIDFYKLSVYNRWGELIFYTNDYYKAWTGYYKNKLVEQGVYVYQVECECQNGTKKSYIKNVTVIH